MSVHDNNDNEASTHQLDRRQSVAFKDLVTPIIIAIVVGIGSSFVTTSIAVNSLELKVQYLEKNVDTLLQLVKDINRSEMQISRIESWMEAENKRVDRIDQRLEEVEKLKYSK